MPILKRRASRMLCSTVSNAALKSRRTRRVTCMRFIFMRTCHSGTSVALFLCCDPFGKRIARLDKG